ncbi:MAG: DNA polymerase III subunit delta [Candidatus Kerfeldbacteria bacterium]|nr:DNA polymerase III subunit delta [Candidatus Kerfeldbacteria bacterium]
MLIYLRGEDDYRSEEALKALVGAFKEKHDPLGMSVTALDGEALTPDDLERALTTQGLLSAKRLVVIRDLVKNRRKETLDHLEKVVAAKRIPAENIVIVWERTAPEAGKRVHALYTTLTGLPPRSPRAKGKDYQQRFDAFVGQQLDRWVDAEAAARDIRLVPAARGLLVSLAGSSLRTIANELEKLSHFRPGSTMTEEDVKQFVHANLEADIFDLTDTIGARDFPRAAALLERQFLAGAAPLYVLTMLTRHFRILRQVQAAGPGHPSTLARELKLHPFVVGKAVRQGQNFSTAELVTLFDDLVALDAKLKSSSADPKVELTLFVERACRTEASRMVGE